ncbi:MAG TPA: CBS domain-containing protein [Kofleriaceae bacterium]|nr:CBS domain-containing protein [Kofleriaceae bacterium]
MKAQDLMSKPAVTCHVNDSLNVAAQKMWEHDCGALAVVNDDGALTGMITDRDVCMAAYTQGRPLSECLVHTAMSTRVRSATAEQSASDLAQIMAEGQIRRVPIVDAANVPIGMVSLNDLAIEASRPNTAMKHGLAKIAHTLAAICKPRVPHRQAA